MGSIYSIVHAIVFWLNGVVWGWPQALPAIVVLLVGTGIITTFRLGWVQIRLFTHGLKVVRGDFDHPEDEGDLSHFQALTTALSATVGIGNIAGVATAIHYGGPGAIFWMWVTAVFGMALKFTECTLSLRFRRLLPGGSVAGGPMYSIERGLGKKWKPLAIAFATFAVISSFGAGNSVQSFTVADQFRQDLGIPTWITGLIMASLVAAVILGGIRRIGRVTSKLVPFMAALYVGAGLIVLALNWRAVPGTLALIVSSAFEPAAGVGGFAGAGFIFMLTWGVKRGLFSNESGQGSAPIAHAAAKTDEPVREGSVAMIGPFVDTLLICTMTALVILTTGVWRDKQEQRVILNRQAAVTMIRSGARVERDSIVRSEDLATGIYTVVAGRPIGFELVRNHSIVDAVQLDIVADPVLMKGAHPFTGQIVIPAAFPGDVARAILRSSDGEPVRGALVLSGRAAQNGSPLTAWAFQRGLGRYAGGFGHLIVTIAVFLFGLSTAISWSYYGDRSIFYLLGPRAILPYRIVFCIMNFLGAIYSLELVWSFGDVALGLMTIPNLLSILLLTGLVKFELRDYIRRGQTKAGA